MAEQGALRVLSRCREAHARFYVQAKVNLAVTQSTASFFDPSEPLSQLETVISGNKALGYTFVSPTEVPS
jgi:hypothetical protein